MQPRTTSSAGLAAGLITLILTTSTAFGQQPKQQKTKPTKAIRAMRLTAAGSGGKPPTQADLKKRYTDKLAGKWIANADWTEDFEKAKATAAASGKLIVTYFTRSYAP